MSASTTTNNTAPAAPAGVQYGTPALLKVRQETIQYLQRAKHDVEALASFKFKIEDLCKHALSGNLTPEERKIVMTEIPKLVAMVNDSQKKLAPFVKLQRERLVKVQAVLRRTAPAARPAATQPQTPNRVRLQQVPASQACHVVCNLSLPQMKLTVTKQQGLLHQLVAGKACVLMLDSPQGRSFKLMATLPPMGLTQAGRNVVNDGMRAMAASINHYVKATKTRAAAGKAAAEAAAAAAVVATRVNPAGPVIASVELRRSARNKN